MILNKKLVMNHTKHYLAMKGLTNNDLSPIIDDLTKCMQNPEETEETIQKLAGVVFVQIVDGAVINYCSTY